MSQFQSFFVASRAAPRQCDELNHFLRSHRIIRLSQGFVPSGDSPGFQILVEYADGADSEPQKSRRVDYRAMLKDDAQRAEFDAMKNFRAELCKRDKLVGAYMICKDEHLHAMVTNPNITLEELEAMPHSANIKLGEYGKLLLDELARIRRKAADESDKVPF